MSAAGAERPDYRLIEDERGLLEAVSVLESELDSGSAGPQPLYLDTEFESGRQGIRLCLLQVLRSSCSTPCACARWLRSPPCSGTRTCSGSCTRACKISA
jgi:hypothetical protein